eukprot:TRINITY_DN65794_c0_g1_i1.p1 TRINITY_DN65794_c0_g1~~TRINITY_DN65794_c0_g1_i1.p1  ORF type:complete len:397 (-),score=87.49 TRINITY_DN65794_c0_g1_i1:82-1188(-)
MEQTHRLTASASAPEARGSWRRVLLLVACPLALAAVVLCAAALLDAPASARQEEPAPRAALAIPAVWNASHGLLRGDRNVRIACVGDSITFGYGVPSEFSYPTRLKGHLGPHYDVLNFGVPYSKVSRDDPASYWNTPAFEQAIASEPDVVIIMLGTNDATSYPLGDYFEPTYRELIERFQKLASRPQVFLMTPPPCYLTNDPEHVHKTLDQLMPLTIARLAADAGLPPAVDIFSVFKNQCPELSFDNCEWMQGHSNDNGIHPNRDGYEAIARTVFHAICPHCYMHEPPVQCGAILCHAPKKCCSDGMCCESDDVCCGELCCDTNSKCVVGLCELKPNCGNIFCPEVCCGAICCAKGSECKDGKYCLAR